MSPVIEEWARLWDNLDDQNEMEMYSDGNDYGANDTRQTMRVLWEALTWEEQQQAQRLGHERVQERKQRRHTRSPGEELIIAALHAACREHGGPVIGQVERDGSFVVRPCREETP